MELLIIIDGAYLQQDHHLHHLQVLPSRQSIHHHVIVPLHRVGYLIGLEEEANWEMVGLAGVDQMEVLDDEGFYVEGGGAVVFVEDLVEFWDVLGLADGELADHVEEVAEGGEALLLGRAEGAVEDEADSAALFESYLAPEVSYRHFTELLSCEKCLPRLLLDAIRLEYLKSSLKIVPQRQQLEYFPTKHRLIQIMQHPAICPQLAASIRQLLAQGLIEDHSKHGLHSLHQQIQDPIMRGSQQKHIALLLEPLRALEVAENYREYIRNARLRAIGCNRDRVHQEGLALQLLSNQSINSYHVLREQLVELAH